MVNIKDVFTQDHRILNKMLVEYAQSQKSKSRNSTQLFNDVRNAINKHIKEEEELYNTFHKTSAELDDIIKSVRTQHEQIKKLLDNMHDVCDEEPEECENRTNELLSLTNYHERFEEEYLYTKFDELLSEKEKDRAIYEIQSRYKMTE